jgi:hypothetical protein
VFVTVDPPRTAYVLAVPRKGALAPRAPFVAAWVSGAVSEHAKASAPKAASKGRAKARADRKERWFISKHSSCTMEAVDETRLEAHPTPQPAAHERHTSTASHRMR